MPVWREEARAILKKEGIGWREDSSNFDRRFTRNRIRLDLMPRITELFGEEASQHIYSAIRMLYRTRQALEECFRLRYEKSFIGGCEGILTFRAEDVLKDSFTFGEMLRQTLPQLGIGLQKFSRSRIEHAYSKLTSPVGRQICHIYRTAFAVRQGNWLIIADHTPIQINKVELPIGGEVELEGDLGSLRADITEPPERILAGDRLTAYLKYGGGSIFVKPYQKGFLFHPLGGVSMKLSTFLKKRGVPAILRRALPLLFIERKLAWVAGVEISEQFKLNGDEDRVLRVEWSGAFPEIVSAAMVLAQQR